MEAGFTTGDSTSQFSLNVQFKSNILVPFSAQKLSNCLAAVNETVPQAERILKGKKFTACSVKFQSLQNPVWGCRSGFKQSFKKNEDVSLKTQILH